MLKSIAQAVYGWWTGYCFKHDCERPCHTCDIIAFDKAREVWRATYARRERWIDKLRNKQKGGGVK